MRVCAFFALLLIAARPLMPIVAFIPSTKLVKLPQFISTSGPTKPQPSGRIRNVLSKVNNIRAGSLPVGIISSCSDVLLKNPSNLFNGLLAGLAASTLLWKFIDAQSSISDSKANRIEKPIGVKSLQARFLVVFWLMRMADWLQGPYFYEVYSSKVFNGIPASLDLVSKLFLVGFATTGICGPWIGRLVDSIGRKAGTLVFALLYALSALSTRSSHLVTLLLGRFAGGLGTSLLFSAPEAWLIGEHQRGGFDGRWLGQTFGWAYAGDSLVAITAGQLASIAASSSSQGPSGPFTLSIWFLAAGAILAFWKWGENTATSTAPSASVAGSVATTAETEGSSSVERTTAASDKPRISDAISIVSKDRCILLLGAVQALFEGSMYIFVLQWPPAIKAAIQASRFGAEAAIPFGNIFSCFMASCLLGSTVFGSFQNRKVSVERSTSVMLLLATTAVSSAALVGSSNLAALTAAFFLFEVCVGMYFPSIGTLRSKYLPDSHRSVIMNLFGIPLNLIVVSVFMSIKSLGVQGALQCAGCALALATVCMAVLSNSKSNDTMNAADDVHATVFEPNS